MSKVGSKKYKSLRNLSLLLGVAFVITIPVIAPMAQRLLPLPAYETAWVYADTEADGGEVDTGGKLSESLPGGTRKNDCQPDSGKELNAENCGIVKWLQAAINVFSAAAGLVIVVVIIWAGIQYTTSRDDPQAIAAAKGRIVNAIIGLALFIFFYALLQWIVPGGVL